MKFEFETKYHKGDIVEFKVNRSLGNRWFGIIHGVEVWNISFNERELGFRYKICNGNHIGNSHGGDFSQEVFEKDIIGKLVQEKENE
jgi:hypothetical protein